jgi:hypothetical protein
MRLCSYLGNGHIGHATLPHLCCYHLSPHTGKMSICTAAPANNILLSCQPLMGHHILTLQKLANGSAQQQVSAVGYTRPRHHNDNNCAASHTSAHSTTLTQQQVTAGQEKCTCSVTCHMCVHTSCQTAPHSALCTCSKKLVAVRTHAHNMRSLGLPCTCLPVERSQLDPAQQESDLRCLFQPTIHHAYLMHACAYTATLPCKVRHPTTLCQP